MLQSTTLNKEMGDSLSQYKNIDFILADDPEQLRVAIASIKLPFKIIAIYSQGSKHVAWIVPSRKLIKKTKG